jgi:hypothetical protein
MHRPRWPYGVPFGVIDTENMEGGSGGRAGGPTSASVVYHTADRNGKTTQQPKNRYMLKPSNLT